MIICRVQKVQILITKYDCISFSVVVYGIESGMPPHIFQHSEKSTWQCSNSGLSSLTCVFVNVKTRYNIKLVLHLFWFQYFTFIYVNGVDKQGNPLPAYPISLWVLKQSTFAMETGVKDHESARVWFCEAEYFQTWSWGPGPF